MKHIAFEKTSFVKTTTRQEHWPKRGLPEIAVAGRSNVGKSTLLTHLFRNKNLVKTSSIPGKTQEINYFCTDEKLYFVDLPGYGYAKAPLASQKKWSAMIDEYLHKSPHLKLILFLLDSRRTPNEKDQQMMQWMSARGLPCILVLTKVDKLKKSELRRQTQKILDTLQTDTPYVHYSAVKNQGRDVLIECIVEVLA